MTVRPTLRCLSEDLSFVLPSIDEPLHEIDHPLIKKANGQFTLPTGPRERIRSIDDVVMFKVKVQRWRGAVVEAGEPGWMVTAGVREAGSRDDFYEALATAAVAALTRYNSEHRLPLKSSTYCGQWQPDEDDRDRHRSEAAVRMLRAMRDTVWRLVRASLLDGHEHAGEVAGAELGVLVQGAEDRGTYVALWITGSVPDNLVAVVLDLVPGCDRDGWYPSSPCRLGRCAPANRCTRTSWTRLLRLGCSKRPATSQTSSNVLIQQHSEQQREWAGGEEFVRFRVLGEAQLRAHGGSIPSLGSRVLRGQGRSNSGIRADSRRRLVITESWDRLPTWWKAIRRSMPRSA